MAAKVGLGVRGQKGGAVIVALALDAGEPRVLLSTFLATAAAGDRLALEPYGVAAEEARRTGGPEHDAIRRTRLIAQSCSSIQESERVLVEKAVPTFSERARAAAETVVAEGRRRQDQLAAEGLQDIIARLGRQPVLAALLVNRAGWITDLLSYSLAWAEHVPVAEGLAVRAAMRSAFAKCGLEAAEMDEKSLPDLAAQVLDRSPGEVDARLKALGSDVGRPWRKEQKLACLAAWVATAG